MRIDYVRIGGSARAEEDGGAIFDRKTVAHLRALGAEVREIPIERRRALRLPLWAGKPRPLGAGPARPGGAPFRILSHEATFGLMGPEGADAVIVHNHFAHFSFPGRPLLEDYYRRGAAPFYRQAFAGAVRILFLSHRERRLAERDDPSICGRTAVLVPPPADLPLGARRLDLVHVSGTERWRPKRLCRLTAGDRALLAESGLEIGDFGAVPAPAFGLVNDRFTVGFKLKLMQMIHARDAIASLADLEEEIEAVAPGYPFWRRVRSVAEARDYFLDLRERMRPEEIDARFREAGADWRLPDWSGHAAALLAELTRR